MKRLRLRSDDRAVQEGLEPFPDDLPEPAPAPELEAAALDDEALRELFTDDLDGIHPRLTRTLADIRRDGGDAAA